MRQPYLDSLRGVAALIVVIHHYLLVFYPYSVYGTRSGYVQHYEWENIFFYPPFGIVNAGRFAICLFFIISGYVLSYSNLGESSRIIRILASIIKRPLRLGGIVFFSIICGAFLWYCGGFANSLVADLTTSKWFGGCWANQFDVHRLLFILKTSVFSRGRVYNPPLWTIKIELYGSVLVFAYLLVLAKFRYRIIFSILLVILFRNSLYQGFWIGLCVADLVKNYNLLKILVSTSIFYPVAFFIFVFFSSYPAFVSNEFISETIYAYFPTNGRFDGGGYPMLSAFLLFVLVLVSTRAKKYLGCPLLVFLGEISYGIYAMHFLLLGSFSSWLFINLRNYWGYNASFIVVLLVSQPIIVVVAWLVTKYIDKPSIRLSGFVGRNVVDLFAKLRRLALQLN